MLFVPCFAKPQENTRKYKKRKRRNGFALVNAANCSCHACGSDYPISADLGNTGGNNPVSIVNSALVIGNSCVKERRISQFPDSDSWSRHVIL